MVANICTGQMSTTQTIRVGYDYIIYILYVLFDTVHLITQHVKLVTS